MPDPNQAVFDAAQQVFTQTVVDGAGQRAAVTASALRQELNIFVENFYTHMLDVSLPVFSKAWLKSKPLSERYNDRKAKFGTYNQFYAYKNNLIPWLRGRSALKDFGRSRTGVSLGGAGGLRDGFRQEGTRIRNLSTGQYSSRLTAFGSLVFRVEFQIFPKLDGKNHYDLFDVYKGNEKLQNAFRSTELGRPKGKQPPRNLLLPSLRVYRNDMLPQLLTEKFGLKP